MFISYIPQTYENLIVSAQISNDISIPDVLTIECKDSSVFFTILEALANKKKVTFSNTISDLSLSDLQITDSQYFGKQQFLYALYNEAIKHFRDIPQYSYFRYSFLNNIFASKGYFVTPENSQSIYLKILDSKDENLIKHLEEFIELQQELNQYEQMYQCFINAKNRMLEADSSEETCQAILIEAQEFLSSAHKEIVTLDSSGWFSTLKGDFVTTQNPKKSEIGT